MDDEIRSRFDNLQQHLDTRFDEVHRILLQLQSDLNQFFFHLGKHESRLDNLEGK